MDQLEQLASEGVCYLTTTGRKTGNPHTIEIWFAASPQRGTIYMLSGGGERSDWVKNIARTPEVEVRIGHDTFRGVGRVVRSAGEESLARHLVVRKYYGRERVKSTGWAATSLPVAVDLQA